MSFSKFVSVAAIVAATSLPFAAQAQETHVLTPHFPDAFKLRSTTVSDAQTTIPDDKGGSQTQPSHSTVAWTTDAHKTADGYHATVSVDTVDFSGMTTPASPAGAPGGWTRPRCSRR